MAAQGTTEVTSGIEARDDGDVTRGADGARTAEFMAQLSEIVAGAGATDVAQGAELLALSEDIQAMSAVVALMSTDDLDHGMELARIAGELWTASDVVALLDMPVLSDFLEQRGERLQQIAVDTIVRFGSTRALSKLVAETGATVGDMGTEEMAEGLTRSVASAAMAASSQEFAEAGVESTE